MPFKRFWGGHWFLMTWLLGVKVTIYTVTCWPWLYFWKNSQKPCLYTISVLPRKCPLYFRYREHSSRWVDLFQCGMHYYHPRMRVGNVFGRVCLSVCPPVCPSVCLSVQTITFELLHIGTSFLVWRYILTISRSSLSFKVIGSRSRSGEKNDYSLISTCYSFVCDYK